MVSLYSNMNRLETAKEYHQKVMTIDPAVPETYFSIGVINWIQAYQPRMEQRARLNLKPADPLINAEGCWNIRAANEEPIKEGIEMLTTAITLRPDYDDAMAYMNLMYRERADIQCANREAYDADIKMADKWVDLTISTKKAKFEAVPAKIHAGVPSLCSESACQ